MGHAIKMLPFSRAQPQGERDPVAIKVSFFCPVHIEGDFDTVASTHSGGALDCSQSVCSCVLRANVTMKKAAGQSSFS